MLFLSVAARCEEFAMQPCATVEDIQLPLVMRTIITTEQ